jgi:hypothetical protein
MKVWRDAARRECLTPKQMPRGNHQKGMRSLSVRSRNVTENKGSITIYPHEFMKTKELHDYFINQ